MCFQDQIFFFVSGEIFRSSTALQSGSFKKVGISPCASRRISRCVLGVAPSALFKFTERCH